VPVFVYILRGFFPCFKKPSYVAGLIASLLTKLFLSTGCAIPWSCVGVHARISLLNPTKT